MLNGEASLSFTNEKGAALILPFEACREDTRYRNYMVQNYRQWHRYLKERSIDVKPSDIILVTGCDTSSQWATATYYRNIREVTTALEAQTPVVEVKFSISAGWGAAQAVKTREGPPQALARQQTRRPDREETQPENESEMPVNNQCIFLRGFYVKERLIIGPQVMKAGAGYHDAGKYGRKKRRQRVCWLMRV